MYRLLIAIVFSSTPVPAHLMHFHESGKGNHFNVIVKWPVKKDFYIAGVACLGNDLN